MKILNKNELMLCSGGASYITTTERMNVEGISELCVQALYKFGLHRIESPVPDQAMVEAFTASCTNQDSSLVAQRARNMTLLSITLS